MPVYSQRSLLLINRPRRDGTLSWRWHTAATVSLVQHRCRKRFFTFFNVFILSSFFISKNVHWNSINKFEKPFWSHRNELIGLDSIMKVAWFRAALYPLLTSQHNYVGSWHCLYSDTADVTSCSRQSQNVKSRIATNWIKISLSLVPAILHPQHWPLGKRLNKLGLTFLFNVFKSFLFFSRTFFTSMSPTSSRMRSRTRRTLWTSASDRLACYCVCEETLYFECSIFKVHKIGNVWYMSLSKLPSLIDLLCCLYV